MERIALIFLGPPGSGKGTQAKKLVEKFNFIHISTGDLLREAVRKGTELGKKAKEYMDRGELVPDEIIMGIVKEAISEKGNIVFDGFPRTLNQARLLEELLKEKGIGLKNVLLFDISDDLIVKRLLARRVCPKCGRVYNLITSPPEEDELCDVCKVKLEKRSDDNEETIRRRLEVYHGETAPLIEYYRNKGILKRIDATLDVDSVFKQIVNLLS